MSKYLFDTNFFLDASLRYYQPDFFNDFWKWIKKLSEEMKYRSILKVKKELNVREDYVSKFVNNLPNNFFIDDKKYLESYVEVIECSVKMNFNDTAKKILQISIKLTRWLIAVAKQDNYTIVSNEKTPDKKERKEIKIPRMCNELNIKCIDIFNFIIEKKLKFKIENMPKASLFEQS